MNLDLTTLPDDWNNLSKTEQRQHLFDKQKDVLDAFLERHVISQEQYDISLRTLVENMDVRAAI